MKIKIRDKYIGDSCPCFIIAEAGVNHNGDLKLAYKLIDIAKLAGADAIKFQTFKSEKLVTKDAKKASYQCRNQPDGKSQLKMLQSLELKYQDYIGLKQYSEKRGLIFLSTPFEDESAEFLNSIGMDAFKISSGDLVNHSLLRKIANWHKPIILSTGMATISEIIATDTLLKSLGSDKLIYLHCTTNYPTPFQEVNLRAMYAIKEATGCLIGYSDHTPGILVSALAVSMGARVIEKHFTLDKSMEGPDHKASLDPTELEEMVKQIRLVEKIMGDGQKVPTKSEQQIAKVARKSLMVTRNLPKGHIIRFDDLTAIRPGTGISPDQIAKIVGKKVIQSIKKDTLLRLKNIDQEDR